VVPKKMATAQTSRHRWWALGKSSCLSQLHK
jgi:hypothetical protein